MLPKTSTNGDSPYQKIFYIKDGGLEFVKRIKLSENTIPYNQDDVKYMSMMQISDLETVIVGVKKSIIVHWQSILTSLTAISAVKPDHSYSVGNTYKGYIKKDSYGNRIFVPQIKMN